MNHHDELPPMNAQDWRDFRHAIQMVRDGDENFKPVVNYFLSTHNRQLDRPRIAKLLDAVEYDLGATPSGIGKNIDWVSPSQLYSVRRGNLRQVPDENLKILEEMFERWLRDGLPDDYEHPPEYVPAKKKLSDEDIEDIKDLYERSDMNQVEVAREYGLHRSTVSRIVRGMYR